MDQWILSALCLPSPKAEELSVSAARVLHPLSAQLPGISVQFDLLSWMSCWSILEGSMLFWVKALEREQWFTRGCKLLHLALGKTIYITAGSQDFTASNFLVILLWTLFTLEKIEEVALNVSLNIEQQELDWDVWIAEGLKWQLLYWWVLKPLKRLSVTLFTLPNVPEAHSETLLGTVRCSHVCSAMELKALGICLAAGKAGWEVRLPWRAFKQD